jgi:predicted metal-dependent peptidase
VFKDVNVCIQNLSYKDSFIADLASTLEMVVFDDTEFPVAAVGINSKDLTFFLGINEKGWSELNKQIKQGVIQHELLHLCFFHLTEFSHLIKQSSKLSNIAFDLLVNQYVNKSILPSWGIFLDEFQKRYPKLELPPFQTSEYYFKELKKDKDIEEKYIIDPNAQHGWGLIDENGNPVVLNEAQEELLKERLSGRLEELANNAKAQGNAPSYCDQFIKEFIKPKPKFNYKKYIKTFVGNSTEYIVRKSYYKANPRFPDNPRVIQEPKGKILVLVDESGLIWSLNIAIY